MGYGNEPRWLPVVYEVLIRAPTRGHGHRLALAVRTDALRNVRTTTADLALQFGKGDLIEVAGVAHFVTGAHSRAAIRASDSVANFPSGTWSPRFNWSHEP